MTTGLTVRDLKVWYGNTEIIRDVSFDVGQGQVVALLGGNGAGKTTVLRTLSGMVKPRSGQITFGGQRIGGLSAHDVVVKGVVQVPQGRYVWPSMTVLDNLLLGGVTRPKKAELPELLQSNYELFPMLKRRQADRAGQLSGGEQQMLAIARALMARPRMLLMDEPSAGLSPRMTQEMVEAMRELHRRGLGILLIEQNVGVAAALAERAIVLANGIIAMETDGAGLATNPKVISSYLGRS